MDSLQFRAILASDFWQRLANGFEARIWAEFGAKFGMWFGFEFDIKFEMQGKFDDEIWVKFVAKFDFLADLVRFAEIGDGGVFDTA